MPVDLTQEDEVYTALEAARQFLIGEHRPRNIPLDCRGCFVLWIVEGGITAYMRRAGLAHTDRRE